ncbi:MAG: hypothetical protein J6V89_02725, partial [Acetobacter sp.]|nr:hypothetical protein [Acetobacter sp.]
QPTFETCQSSYVYAHPEIENAGNSIPGIYEMKPALLYLKLILYTPTDQLNNLLNINTIQGLQNFQQQLQKKHLLTDGAPPLPPPPPPPINWAQYKITFSSVLAGAIERMFDPLLIKTSIRKLEQQLQGVHQQLQGVHQQLQGIHQQLQGLHQKLQQLHQAPQTPESFGTPQESLNTVESVASLEPGFLSAGASGIINYQKAVIAAQNGNNTPLIAIYKQAQPQTWQNYFVNYYTFAQTHPGLFGRVKVIMK